jgi:hypothetical protein
MYLLAIEIAATLTLLTGHLVATVTCVTSLTDRQAQYRSPSLP